MGSKQSSSVEVKRVQGGIKNLTVKSQGGKERGVPEENFGKLVDLLC